MSTSDESKIQDAFNAYFGGGARAEDAPKAKRAQDMREARDRTEAALRRAERAARKGDAAGAKHWTDIAARMSAALRTLADTPPPEPDWQEEERLSAELRERLARIAEVEGGMQRWTMRHEIWTEMCAEAAREGRPPPPPMPPRPPHWTDSLPADLRARLLEEDQAWAALGPRAGGGP